MQSEPSTGVLVTPGSKGSRRFRVDWVYRVGVVLAALLYAAAVVRTAWLADDSFVTFRAVRNLLDGQGFVSNPPERVMGYSNPLWAFAVLVPMSLGINVYWAAMATSLVCSAATAFVLAKKAAQSAPAAILVLLWLALSTSFIDYSTSGLENPLSHLLLALFFVRVLDTPSWTSPVPWTFAALLGINRLDHLLLVLPALVIGMLERLSVGRNAQTDNSADQTCGTARKWPRWPVFRAALIGFSPLFLWLIFALVYYGFIFPNTAFAKLNTRIPPATLATHGLLYLKEGLLRDPLTMIVIVLAIATSVYERSRRGVMVAVGLVLYLGYIVRIGGDYMMGRFVSAPFTVAVAWLAGVFLHQRSSRQLLALIGVTVPLIVRVPQTTSGSDKIDCAIGANGITDERRCYAEFTALTQNLRFPKYRRHEYYRKGARYRRDRARVAVEGLPGMCAFAAGPTVHMIDLFALTDPLLARMPYKPNGQFRIGHFVRTVPRGYVETIKDDRNELENPCLRRYYDLLTPVIRGPLFTRERWGDIVALNLGKYDDLVRKPCRRGAHARGSAQR